MGVGNKVSRCKAVTQAGKRCTRTGEHPFCFQHVRQEAVWLANRRPSLSQPSAREVFLCREPIVGMGTAYAEFKRRQNKKKTG